MLYIPTDSDVKNLMEYVQGNEIEVRILLAAFGPMRRGEICALKHEDISNNVVHVHRSLALDENRNWIEKAPKTASSDRYIDFPEFVIDKIGKRSGNITTLTPDSISHRFKHILTNVCISHFRFHDLRQYYASIQHAIGIPDVYIMQRGGRATNTVLKEVYRHTLADKVYGMNQKANDHFSTLCNTK